MTLADSRMDCLRGCLATLSVLVVRIALLEYSKIHVKAYKFIVCEFEGFQYVLRDACVRAIPIYLRVYRLSDTCQLCDDYYILIVYFEFVVRIIKHFACLFQF